MTHTTDISIGSFVKDAYREYGNYVLEERAVPDFRDGLKPVQRRILWAMYELGFKPNAHWAKSAETVGKVIGQYHPHGDAAVYNALVKMVNARYPLIQGHGNFGSELDSSFAAMRYTESRLAELSNSCFDCIDVADFVDNYSGKQKEPLVLPSRLPTLLLNGSQGIAVGLAVNIPPHNYTEVISAVHACIDTGVSLDTILEHIKGPDYGKGVLISSKEEIRELYATGNGTLRYRCQFKIEDNQIIITGFAPNFDLDSFIKKCAKFVDDGLIDGYVDDSSEDNGILFIIEFSDPHVINDHILPLLETSILYNFYVTRREFDKVDVVFMPITDFVRNWLDWRYTVEERMLKLELHKHEESLSHAEAKLIAIKNLKTLYSILSKNEDFSLLKDTLVSLLDITKDQAEIILSMSVRSLSKANIQDQLKEIEKIKKSIQAVKKQLGNIWDIVKANLPDMDDRRGTKIGKAKELDVEDVNVFFGVHDDGTGQRIIDLNGVRKKKAWNWLVSGKEFTIIEKTGMAYRLSLSQIKDGDTGYKNIVGVISDQTEKFVVLSTSGLGLCVEHPAARKYLTMKLADTDLLISAIGVTGFVWVWNDVKCEVHKDIKAVRNGSKGVYLIPRQKANRVLSVPKNGIVVSPTGVLTPTSICGVETVFAVGSSNLVFFEEKKEILGKNETTELILAGKVEAVFPI